MLRDEIATIIRELHWDSKGGARVTYFEIADAILNLPEMVEMREKMKAYDKLMEEWFTHEKEYHDVRDMIAEWKEKAEKWDKLYDDYGDPYEMIKDFQSMQKQLMVRELCHEEIHYQTEFGREHKVSQGCGDCGGTGTIERPAKVEEVRQFIVEAYQILGTFGYVYADSQKTLFMKDGVKTESRQDEASSPMKGEGK